MCLDLFIFCIFHDDLVLKRKVIVYLYVCTKKGDCTGYAAIYILSKCVATKGIDLSVALEPKAACKQ